MAYEEPEYETVTVAKGYELRRYGDRLAAQVLQSSNEDGAFGRLFRYISGANQSSAKISMTVPVAQSETIAMTVPVAQSFDGGSATMQFFLPSTYTIKTAPTPRDPNVRIVQVYGGLYAVRRYSGRANRRNYEFAKSELLERLSEDGLQPTSAPIRATYNGPFTPPFLRRNEVMVRLD